MKKKIAVLGGGLSSITTVFELTDDPNWQDKYDITVYQLGWRLGGKGASGRNRNAANRIQEHGVHLWFGFYDNSFEVLQRCYKANNRPLNKPLATWQEAFRPGKFYSVEEQVGDQWMTWPFVTPTNDDVPGSMKKLPTIWEYVRHAMTAVYQSYADFAKAEAAQQQNTQSGCIGGLARSYRHLVGSPPALPGGQHRVFFEGLEHWWEKIAYEVEALALDLGGILIYGALRIVESVDKDDQKSHNDLLRLLERILKWLWARLEQDIDSNTDARRLWIEMDMGFAVITGLIRDGVITKGFSVLDHIDFRVWLQSHGASDITINGAPLKGMYELVFSGPGYGTYAASTALRVAMRSFFAFRGAFFYRMQAGMGDVIFSPMYEVLKKRGVRFAFFHKVENLGLSADQKSVETIQIGVQATVKAGPYAYEPLYDVKGLPSWPNTPFYEQLKEGEQIKSENVNLESYWADWNNPETKILRKGVDFDIIVQGISIGAIPVIAKELVNVSKAWSDMVAHIATMETQAFQLWFYPDLAGLGWPFWTGGAPLSGGYTSPFNYWADMSHLITKESWPDNATPNNIAYICGPLARKKDPYDWHFDRHGTLQDARMRARENALAYIRAAPAHFWPHAEDSAQPADFNWDLLVTLGNEVGQERFSAQYFRANINPSDLYVMCEAGANAYRLKTDQTGFDDLYITGDWIDTGFNLGCSETAIMAGKQTARAISGEQFEIFGEKDAI